MVAAVLFLFQVTAGLLAISDFVNLVNWFGVDLRALIPVTVSRMWHSQFSVLWVAVCWFAATIWVLPLICRPEPCGQLASINLLFAMLVMRGFTIAIRAGSNFRRLLAAGIASYFGAQAILIIGGNLRLVERRHHRDVAVPAQPAPHPAGPHGQPPVSVESSAARGRTMA